MNRPLLLFSILLVAGCGGGGGDRSGFQTRPASVDALVGLWRGSYGPSGKAAEGTVTIRIAPRVDPGVATVQITGTVSNSTEDGTVIGSIEDGSSYASVESPYAEMFLWFPSSSSGSGAGGDFRSVARIDRRGHLILRHLGGTTSGVYYVPDDFDLARVATP